VSSRDASSCLEAAPQRARQHRSRSLLVVVQVELRRIAHAEVEALPRNLTVLGSIMLAAGDAWRSCMTVMHGGHAIEQFDSSCIDWNMERIALMDNLHGRCPIH